MPEVSIVVPAWNAARFLPATLDSLLGQDLRDIQVVVVDDGSTDDTAMIAEQRAAIDARVHVLRGPNAGVSAARNRGLAVATGKFVLFLDSDDIAAAGMLSTMVAVAEGDASDVVLCSLVRFGLGPDRTVVAPELRATSLSGMAEHLPHLAATSLIHHLGNKIFRRDLIDAVGARFPEGMSIGEDLLFVLSVLDRARLVSCIPDPLYRYRLHGGGTLSVRYHAAGLEAYASHHRGLEALFRRCAVGDSSFASLDDRLVFDLYHHVAQSIGAQGSAGALAIMRALPVSMPREWAIVRKRTPRSLRAMALRSGLPWLVRLCHRLEMEAKRRIRP